MKSPLLAFIKFEPTFLTGSLAVCLSAPIPAFTQEFRSGRQGEAGGRGVWSLPFRPPSPLIKSVRIFSNTHRQKGFCKRTLSASLRSAANLYGILGEKEMHLSIRAKEIFSF